MSQPRSGVEGQHSGTRTRTVSSRYGFGIRRLTRLIEPAARQRGFITTEDAAAVGVPAYALRQMREDGDLAHVGRGVYRLPFPDRRHDDLVLAVLWTRKRGRISGPAALRLRGLPAEDNGLVHLAVPLRYRPRRQGGDNYRLIRTTVDDSEADSVDDIPTVTTVTAIVHSIELGMDEQAVTLLSHRARHNNLLDLDEVHRILLAQRRHRPPEPSSWKLRA